MRLCARTDSQSNNLGSVTCNYPSHAILFAILLLLLLLLRFRQTLKGKRQSTWIPVVITRATTALRSCRNDCEGRICRF